MLEAAACPTREAAVLNTQVNSCESPCATYQCMSRQRIGALSNACDFASLHAPRPCTLVHSTASAHCNLNNELQPRDCLCYQPRSVTPTICC